MSAALALAPQLIANRTVRALCRIPYLGLMAVNCALGLVATVFGALGGPDSRGSAPSLVLLAVALCALLAGAGALGTLGLMVLELSGSPRSGRA